MINRLRLKIFFITLTFFSAIPASNALLITNPAMTITHTVTVQPIILSDDSGINTANYFGDAGQQSSIEGFIDQIWAQAGIDVNFLSANNWNNTLANWGSGGPTTIIGDGDRPTSDLNAVVNAGSLAGQTNANPNVLNMFFVNIAAGFDLLSANTVAGLAFVPGNGVTQYVGTNLLGFEGGREVIASVVAHEIGHNLGLDHLVEAENLLQAAGSANPGERLNSAQIATALASNLSVAAVPVPAAVWLMGSALIGLFGFRRKSA